MKRMMLLSVFTFIATSSLFAAEAPGQKDAAKITQEIGRYQLFQGTFTTLDLKYRQATSTHNGVFLIDTATGQVKRYVNRIDEDGRYIETWLPTDIVQQLITPKTLIPQVEGK